MHVEGDHDAIGEVSAAPVHQVLCQVGSEVGLAGAARPRQDEAAVLQQQADVVLAHGLGDERLKHQAVHTLFLQTCRTQRSNFKSLT